MTRDYSKLTIRHAQLHQPWTVPYNAGIDIAAQDLVPHILATHTALHVAKSAGKLAAVFEEMDHSRDVGEPGRSEPLTGPRLETIKAMSADLITAALRLANLYHFDIAETLVQRVEEKNHVRFPVWE